MSDRSDAPAVAVVDEMLARALPTTAARTVERNAAGDRVRHAQLDEEMVAADDLVRQRDRDDPCGHGIDRAFGSSFGLEATLSPTARPVSFRIDLRMPRGREGDPERRLTPQPSANSGEPSGWPGNWRAAGTRPSRARPLLGCQSRHPHGSGNRSLDPGGGVRAALLSALVPGRLETAGLSIAGVGVLMVPVVRVFLAGSARFRR